MPSARNRYPQLFEFLAAWFPEADFEARTDRAAIEAYRRVAKPAERALVIRQGRALLAARPLPWRAMAEAANRRFSNAEAFAAWLDGVLEALER
ncbi:MAG: hypothetical protein SF182_12830 [Deltaproteobacteria bacterium]|nr:hypothetical protein [Deltaproteobacteria bacterium]